MSLRIVCISDVHLQHEFPLPEGDILIDAGDMTFRGDISEITRAAKWRQSLLSRYEKVIVIAGNHDWLFQKDPTVARLIMQDHGITYLEDSELVVDGIHFYGAPWQPEFGGWAFNLSRMDTSLYDKWEMIPEETQVLITHGPPKGIGDLTAGYHGIEGMKEVYEPPENVGCYDLNERVQKLPNLKLHVFGHIHFAYGEYHRGNITYLNASICNERYKPKNKPHVFTI